MQASIPTCDTCEYLLICALLHFGYIGSVLPMMEQLLFKDALGLRLSCMTAGIMQWVHALL